MNKIFRNILWGTTLLTGFGLASCVNDLDVESIDPNTLTEINPDGLFAKCYANMALAGQTGPTGDCDIDGLDGGTTGFVRQLWNANTLTTDEAICAWGDPGIAEFNFNQWGSSHPMLEGFYYRLYAGITYCNHYIDTYGDYNATMTAEVRFLRAMYYYHLLDCYGNVPFMTHLSSDKAPQASRAEVFNFVESELKDIESTLADPLTNTYGRVDKAAAWLLLARLYLNAQVYIGQDKYSDAATYAKRVMDSDYTLFTGAANGWTAYQMLFMGDNGENGAAVEAILPILGDGITTQSWGTYFYLIASTTAEDMTYRGKSGPGAATWSGNRCRPQLIGKFFANATDAPADATGEEMVAAAKDDRALFWSKGRTLLISSPDAFKEGFSCTKYCNYHSDDTPVKSSEFPDGDVMLMRAAEAYLTYAEALTRAAGATTLTGEALSAVNQVRARAHASAKATMSLDELCDEWGREFYFEFLRRPTLIRFGKYGGTGVTYNWAWKGGVDTGTSFSGDYNIFAIPSNDLSANDGLKQNPGY